MKNEIKALSKLSPATYRQLSEWTRGQVDEPAYVIGLRGCKIQNQESGAKLISAKNTHGFYNDVIVLMVPKWGVGFASLGTVDPGEYYTANPMQPRGCAHLVNGVYRYKCGLHARHKAFVQAGPVRIRRDRNRNGIIDAEELTIIDTGYFAINIHAGGLYGKSSRGVWHPIGRWSAACLNIADFGDWNSPRWREFRDTLYFFYADSGDFPVFVTDFSDVFGVPKLSPAAITEHIVVPGDTAWNIARRYTGGDLGVLRELNGHIKDLRTIFPEDIIRVPAQRRAA